MNLPRPIVMTNGCFDIIHRGHVEMLREAREMGASLVVAVNSDASVMRLKGPTRPVNTLEDRVAVLSAIRWIDLVLTFDGDTPINVIREVKPDILVKGADWDAAHVAGVNELWQWGGTYQTIPTWWQGRSTTDIIRKIRGQDGHD